MFPSPLDRPLRPLVVAFVVFLLAAVAATTMIRHGEQHNRQEERTRVSNLAGDHADALERSIERALPASYALAALVRQGKKLLDFGIGIHDPSSTSMNNPAASRRVSKPKTTTKVCAATGGELASERLKEKQSRRIA